MSFFKKLTKDIGLEEGKEDSTSKEKRKKESPEKNQKEKEKIKKILLTTGKMTTDKKKSSPDWLKAEGQLAVDVYQAEDEFCVQAPIAGVEPQDIDISIENAMLIINGERKEPEKEKEKNYFYQECYWGPFSRQIILPEDIDIQKIKAGLKDGILTIKIPCQKKTAKKKIIVQKED